MIRNKIFTLLLGLLLSMPAFAVDLDKAAKAYETGNYEEAASIYSEALKTEGFSSGLLYNLGNVYYRLGQDGDAMLCYERAKKMDPSNELINQNLKFLSGKIVDANKGSLEGKKGNVEPDAEDFADGIYRMIAIDRASNGWAAFAAMAFILFVGALALYTFTPNILARKTGFFSGLVFLGFAIVFLVFAFMASHQAERKDQAILMAFTTELLENPSANASKASSPLHKGTKIQILDTRKAPDGSEWYQVRLNSDNVGWVKKQDVEII